MGEIRSGDRHITTEQLNLRAAKAATGFKSIGVGFGDAVVIYLRNDIAFFEASFAARLVGAYSVPANWHYTKDEARYLFENSGAKAIVIHADFVEAVRGAFPSDVTVLVVHTPPEIRRAYSIPDAQCEIASNMIIWDDWVERFAPAPPHAVEPPAVMIYTAGTTGRPKGVRRMPPTAKQALATLQHVRQYFFGFAASQSVANRIVTVITGPMYHSAPYGYSSAAAQFGGDVILQPRFDPEELLAMIERFRVTHLHVVPIMFNRLLKLPDKVRRHYDLSSLQFVVHGAAPVSPPIKRAMIEWWGNVINEYYGSTELGIVTACTAEEWLAHPATVGRVLPDTDLQIVGPDGKELPRGTAGLIVAHRRNVPAFTYHGDDAMRQQSEKAGLFAPGDIGYLDTDGFLYLCDRATDMVISGGVNIYPAEIEAELHKMPGVADCAVFGIPDEDYGEALCAVVQLQPQVTFDADDVRAYLRGRVAGYKIPKMVQFATDLPREDSGKIFKRKLREPYWVNAGRQI
jgi:long-chain acyl-CoA synthetase